MSLLHSQNMKLFVHESKTESGKAAAAETTRHIRAAIARSGEAFIILATGASQFDLLTHLVTADLDWSQVTAFHLDEYIGLPATHPASFRRYLKERFADRVPGLRQFHWVNGDAPDPAAECRRLG